MAQEIADSKLIDTWSSDGLKVKPDISKIIEGWQLGEQPPHEYMNWLQNTFGSKLNHILKNGVATWNNTTQYLAGSSVQHNGNVWLCKTTNTNSAPTDANANWKRIITVESLADLSNDYVATTGNQTIAGVKTFSSTISGSINGNSATVTNGVYTTGNQTIAGVKTFTSSPIVPTPTAGTQAVNKDYVDDSAIGVGQTWQDVTGSRVFGTTYTNTTGRAIAVSIAVGATGSATTANEVRLDADGVTIANQQNAPFASGGTTKTTIGSLFSVIPAGSTYSLHIKAGSPNIYSWSELK